MARLSEAAEGGTGVPGSGGGGSSPVLGHAPSVPAVIVLVLARRRVILGVPLLLASIVAVATLLLPRHWTSTAAFTPQSATSRLGRLSNLAAELGVAIPSADAGLQPSFYVDLLGSDALLRRVVVAPLEVVRRDGVERETLAKVDGEYRAAEVEEAVKALRKWLSVRISAKSGIVSLTVRTREPGLSAAVAQQLLVEVDRFNRENQQTQAGAERRFVQERLLEARDSLLAADRRLLAFLESNRDIRNSPELGFEQRRLERVSAERQQVVTALAQAYEEARISEVRDTPLITVVQSPTIPAIPDPRFLLFKTLLVVIASAALILLLAYWRELARNQANDPQWSTQLRELWTDTMADIGRVRRMGRRP